MANIRAHLYISGYVQGVAYRYSAIRTAQHLGVCGWVKNLPDGRVEALVEGEEALVRQMVDWCREGPPSAVVSDVEVSYPPYQGEFGSFELTW
jgi:acylphosphatase